MTDGLWRKLVRNKSIASQRIEKLTRNSEHNKVKDRTIIEMYNKTYRKTEKFNGKTWMQNYNKEVRAIGKQEQNYDSKKKKKIGGESLVMTRK